MQIHVLTYLNFKRDGPQPNFAVLLHGSMHPYTALPPQYIKHWLFTWLSDACIGLRWLFSFFSPVAVADEPVEWM